MIIKWVVIEGTSGLIEQLTLAIDKNSSDYTRLTRFKAGYSFGSKALFKNGIEDISFTLLVTIPASRVLNISL